MRKSILGFWTALVAIMMLTSCGTTSDVVSNRMIQKRKYTKGVHLTLAKPVNEVSEKQEAAKFAEKSDQKAIAKQSIVADQPWTSTKVQSETVSMLAVSPTNTRSKAANKITTVEGPVQSNSPNNLGSVSEKPPKPDLLSEPEPDLRARMRKNYLKAWLTTLVGFGLWIWAIILMFGSGGFLLGAVLVVGTAVYITMYVNLLKTLSYGIALIHRGHQAQGIVAITWLHIIVGSLVIGPFFFIPIIFALWKAFKTRRLVMGNATGE